MKMEYKYLIFKETTSKIYEQPHRSFTCKEILTENEVGQVKFSLRVGSLVFIQAKRPTIHWCETNLKDTAHFLSQVNNLFETP